MDVEAIIGAAMGKRSHEDIISAVRARLYPFEQRLQRVQVWVDSSNSGHVCCLQAWSERGQTLAVERQAGSLPAAIDGAAAALRLALEHGRTSETVTRPYASRVLLALHELDASAPSLLWARRLTGALAGGLDVCRVLVGAPSPASLASGREWLSATRRLLATQRDTRAWCSEALPEGVLADRIIAGAGDWVGELATLARRKGSDWIVVPAGGVSGMAAEALAAAAGCPVLVARAPTTRSTLLVSADAGHDISAALASAAELSEVLNAPVLAFRNILGRPAERFAPEIDGLAERWDQIRRERLPLEAGRRIPSLDVLLGCAPDRAQALLSQALREDAEMILVTATPLQPGSSASDGSLAASVADQAVRSVLLVPVQASSTDERAARRAPPRSGVVPAAGSSPARAPASSARSASRP